MHKALIILRLVLQASSGSQGAPRPGGKLLLQTERLISMMLSSTDIQLFMSLTLRIYLNIKTYDMKFKKVILR